GDGVGQAHLMVNLPYTTPLDFNCSAARSCWCSDTRITKSLDVRNREQQSRRTERRLEVRVVRPLGVLLVEAIHVRKAAPHQPQLRLPLVCEHRLRGRSARPCRLAVERPNLIQLVRELGDAA